MLTKLNDLLAKIKANALKFDDVLQFVDTHYHFTPTAFTNGNVRNEAGQNAGSCRVLSLALLHQLSKEDTLALFAEHYADVLATPQANNHQNIRQFMAHGWQGVHFEGQALQAK